MGVRVLLSFSFGFMWVLAPVLVLLLEFVFRGCAYVDRYHPCFFIRRHFDSSIALWLEVLSCILLWLLLVIINTLIEIYNDLDY